MSKINFDDYNFEVISVETTGSYLLTLNKNSLTFDKSIAEALGYSSHVKLLLDRDNKIFAIQACKPNSLKSIPFSKPESQQKGSVKIQYGAIRNILRSLMGDKWKENMRYQFKGDLIPEKKVMIFELEKFEELLSYSPRNRK